MARLQPGELAKWLVDQSGGDPAAALSAMAIVTVEFFKIAPMHGAP
jgi:hypothetical protein